MPANVCQIIDALNIWGRQGPQSLLSTECYLWAKKELKLCRSEYTSIIENNTIGSASRRTDRTAFFVRSPLGRITIFKSSEAELRPYVCLAISRLSSPVTSDKVIMAVKAIYPYFTPVDLMIQHNLHAPQPRIDQTIRNILVSNYQRPNNRILFKRDHGDHYTYSLTSEGNSFALKAEETTSKWRETLDEEEPAETADPSRGVYSGAELAVLANKSYSYEPSAHKGSGSLRRSTDKKLLNTVILSSGCQCAIDSSHKTFEGMGGLSNYLEGHHLVPLSMQPLFPETNLDCPENIVPLCPNCHSALHYGSQKVRKSYIDKLTAKYREGLNKIGITDDSLKEIFWRFYLCESK
ncbi:MAG: HNH endonuclease signature motif containing protein [Clostridiaceae bacterium]|nr:HNH endonuclease signature motif containing protein [Clostridiaceae bacterium]